MSKFLSNRQKNLKIGISSYTENITVLEITGKVGIGTTNAQDSLDVNGNIRLRSGLRDYYGNVGIGGSILISTGIGISWTTPYAAGLQGNQGTQGLQGTQGNQGTQGLQGNQGTQGTQGLQGNQGNQGTQGLQGTQGNQGTQGLQGNQGTQGTQGLQGNQGTQGLQGTQGNQGTQGLQGNQGTQGLQGTQGNQGTQGLQGNQGTQGTQGLQGNQGTQGLQGTQGSGVQGLQGVQGTQGLQGTQGSGVQGLQGVQGLSGSGGGSNPWVKKTTTYTASNGDQLIADTSGGSFTITLPSSPTEGDSIKFADGNDWSLNGLTVARNGSTIEQLSDDFILDVKGIVVEFVYDGSTWEVYSYSGPQGIQGVQGIQGIQGVQGPFGITSDARLLSISEKLLPVNSGNTVNIVYGNSSSGNVAICSAPTGDITLNVTGIPTDSSFDSQVITFSVIINQTGTARSCTAVNLNGVSETILWSGGSLANAILGVTTTRGYDIYSFTGINTIGSALTTSNYTVLGIVNGGYR
jgi:hypothetical protein